MKPQSKQIEIETHDEYFQNLLLKPLPEIYNEEQKELAISIQNDIINQNPDTYFRDIVGLQK